MPSNAAHCRCRAFWRSFFVSIGLQFDAGFVLSNLPLVILALVVSVVLKAVIAAFALRLAGLSTRSAIGGGLMVGQIGEFSFVIAANGYQGGTGPIDETVYRLIIAVACLSLAVTPLLGGDCAAFPAAITLG